MQQIAPLSACVSSSDPQRTIPACWRITSIIMEVIADLAALRTVSLRVSLYAFATKREYASDGFLCLPALRQNTHQEYKVDD